MKKIILLTLIVVSMFTIVGLMSSWEHTYTREATVTNRQGQTIQATDKQGNEWNYTVSKDDKIKQGDVVILTMHDNTTDSIIKDDKVIDAKVKV